MVLYWHDAASPLDEVVSPLCRALWKLVRTSNPGAGVCLPLRMCIDRPAPCNGSSVLVCYCYKFTVQAVLPVQNNSRGPSHFNYSLPFLTAGPEV